MRNMDSVSIKSFSINILKYVILRKLETSGRHVRCQRAYKIDTGSNGSFLWVDVFRKLFPNTTKTAKPIKRQVHVLQTCNKSSIFTNGNMQSTNETLKITWRVFVVLSKGAAFLGLPDIEFIHLLSMNCCYVADYFV